MNNRKLSTIIASFYTEKIDAEGYDISSVRPVLKIFPEYDDSTNAVLYSAGLVSGNGFKDNAASLYTDNKPSINEALSELTRMLYDDKAPFCVPSIADKNNDLHTVSFIFSKEKGKWIFFKGAMTLEDVKRIIAVGQAS